MASPIRPQTETKFLESPPRPKKRKYTREELLRFQSAVPVHKAVQVHFSLLNQGVDPGILRLNVAAKL